MVDELGTLSLEEAFSQALGEGGMTPDPTNPLAQSAGGERPVASDEQAPGTSEQSDAGATDPLAAAMLAPPSDDESEEAGEADNTVEVDSDDFWSVAVDLGGVDGEITVSDLADGYLRQADYTRKTQELAEQRRGGEEADKFYQQWQDDPAAFTQALAVELGLLDASDFAPGALPEVAKVPTPERMAELIEQRAAELASDDPRLAEYELTQARDEVDGAFDGFQDLYEMSIPPELRQSILEEAVDRGATDLDGLELVFRARLAEAEARVGRTSQQKRTAPSRPGRSGSPVPTTPVEGKVETIEDAYALAQAELAGP